MATQISFHGAGDAPDFLGLRETRAGRAEIVHDCGKHRTILRLTGTRPDEQHMRALLSRAIGQRRVLPALMAELSARAIPVEIIHG